MNAVTTFAAQTAEAVVADCQPLIRDLVFKWSGMCQNLFDAERSELLLKQPTPDDLKVHRSWVNALIRMGRSLGPIVLDPEYPDGRTATELRGRMRQLEHSWTQFHDPMSEEEADKVLRQAFGDDYAK